MATRRSGQVVQRGERVHLVRVYLGRDAETGKRRYHNKTIHGTKKDAQAYLNRVLRDKDMGGLVEPSKVMLNEYLDQWLEASVKPRVRPRTFDSYLESLRLYIRPGLGQRRLSEVTPLDIQTIYSGLTERGLSARTVRYAHSLLRQALEQAVQWQMLQQNPAQRVDLPRQRREEMRALSPQEARQFLEAVAGTRYGALFEVLLTTGLRPGEALGLKWTDVDLEEAGRLTVQRAYAPGRGFEEPKTPRARRTVPLPASTVQTLRRHRKQQAEDRLKAGPKYEDNGLLFTGENGRPVHYRNLVRRHFKPLLKEAGLPETLRLYDLRHSCATILLAAGENPKIVSERLGHASVTLTLDTYSHVLPDMQEQAAAKLEAMLYDQER